MDGHPSCQNMDEQEISGVWLRPMRLAKAGDKIDGHTHNYGHAMIVTSGSYNIKGKFPDGSDAFEVNLKQHEFYDIDKDIQHEITALEDNSSHYCIFPSRFPTGIIAGKNTRWFSATV